MKYIKRVTTAAKCQVSTFMMFDMDVLVKKISFTFWRRGILLSRMIFWTWKI